MKRGDGSAMEAGNYDREGCIQGERPNKKGKRKKVP